MVMYVLSILILPLRVEHGYSARAGTIFGFKKGNEYEHR